MWRLGGYIKQYKARFIIGQTCGVLFAICNNSLFPLALKHVADIAFPSGGGVGGGITKGLGSSLMQHHTTSGATLAGTSVLLACLWIPAVMLLRSFFSYMNIYCMGWVSTRVLIDLRQRLFGHIMKQSLNFFNESRSGVLISRVATETNIAQQALTVIGSDLIKHPVSIIAGTIFLLHQDWKFTLITLVMFPACIIPITLLGKRIRKVGGREEREAGVMSVILQETFAGIRVIKSFTRENHQTEAFAKSGNAQFLVSMRVRSATELASSLVEVAGALGAALALFYVYVSGLSVATFIGLIGGIFLLYDPIKQLSRMHLMIEKCQVGTESIFVLMDQPAQVVDSPTALELKDRSRGEIIFENVSFAYPSNHKNKQALSKVSLEIAAGRYYALVGASGAGKSTFFALLQRFYDVSKGRILLDGKDIRDLTQHSLRTQIGVVTQDTFLFHDTIENNIRYGRLDATDDEVREAARLAHAEEFIVHLPDKYKTLVGDKGCRLSGGQQQRLAIARAILKNAPILLLDEATSALDSESERAVQQALETLITGRTVIAIAHRLSTILAADQIVVFDRGRVVEIGTHQELINSNIVSSEKGRPESGVYRRLYELQFGQGTIQEEKRLPTETLIAA